MKCERGQAGNCPYLYRKGVVGKSGPGQSEVRGVVGVVGVKKAWVYSWGEGVYKSLWTIGVINLNCCFCPLRRCIRGFHVLLSIRPSSLFTLCGFMSSSMASLMRRSMQPDLLERSLVSWNLIKWSRLKLCSATADLLGCASFMCRLCSLMRCWMVRPVCPIYTLPSALNTQKPGKYPEDFLSLELHGESLKTITWLCCLVPNWSVWNG
jgi:hypothetical protein